MSKVRNKIFDLKKKNENLYFSSLNEITIYAFSKISNYNKEEWKKAIPEVINLFYNSLEKIYANTSQEIKNIYKDIANFDIKNVFDLTFNADGKTIEERITAYWVEVGKRIEDKEIPLVNIKEYLVHSYERILRTETNKIENLIKMKKKPLSASLLIIESGCEACEGGEFHPDEDVALPPYHPNCNCTFY